jgi:hypothetical protein
VIAIRSVVNCSRTPVMSCWPRRADATRLWGAAAAYYSFMKFGGFTDI